MKAYFVSTVPTESVRDSRFDAPIYLQSDDYPIPTPCKDEVVIQTILTGLCSTDLKKITEGYKNFSAGIEGRRSVGSRLFLGHETVGRILATGEGVPTSLVGKRVILHDGDSCAVFGAEEKCVNCRSGRGIFCLKKRERVFRTGEIFGGFSEYFVRHKCQIKEIGDQVSDYDAALIEPAAIALNALISALGDQPEMSTLLVFGGGTIAQLIFRLAPFVCPRTKIFACGLKKSQREAAKQQPVTFIDDTINQQAIFSSVIDAVGTSDSLKRSVALSAPLGYIYSIGLDADEQMLPSRAFVQLGLTFKGVHGSVVDQNNADGRDDYDYILRLCGQSKLSLSDLISLEVRPEKLNRAIRGVFDRLEDEDSGLFRVVARFSE